MPHPLIETGAPDAACPIHLVNEQSWPGLAASLPEPARAFAALQRFEAKAGRHILLPGADGALAAVVFGIEADGARRPDPFLPGRLASLLPEGAYRFANPPGNPELATLAWMTDAYRFTRYKTGRAPSARLVPPEDVDVAEMARLAEAIAMGRDLVNTPANDMGPAEIEAAARRVAERHRASVAVITGDDLLARNFPMVHAVGRASSRPPRLIDMRWGSEGPAITLVGKGVAFDTGGLNIKPDNSMALMKKDMGGAAVALTAAQMIMGAGLKIRLRVIVAAVENAISGSAFRPGDVLPSRKGLTVEIGNTDAEGRLILADALALADEEETDLIVDFATLTGAARVALGPDLPPFFTDHEDLAADLTRLGEAVNDPVWRLPLWPGYASWMESKIADINHISGKPLAGAITAAIFLRRFVERTKAHVHFDVHAWNLSTMPGKPEGGEVHAARLIYTLAKERAGG